MYHRFLISVRLLILPAVFLIGLCLSVSSATADYQAGYAALQKEDYLGALQNFYTLAEKGNSEAQFVVGLIFQEGLVFEKDDQEAFKWFSLAAKQGLDKAQYELALLFLYGDGSFRDIDQCIHWLRRSAAQEFVDSEAMLALLYYNNEYFDADDKEALIWARLASATGNSLGNFVLAELYRYGRGVEKNNDLAIDLFQKSAAGGDEDAERMLGAMYLSGEAGWMKTLLGFKILVVYVFEEAIFEDITWQQYGTNLMVEAVIEIRNFLAFFRDDDLPDT